MSERALTTVAFLAACAIVGVHSVVLGPWMLDDAFIFFRYAENWAAGHGLLWNVGEPPVEGFTSFLWLALLTIVHSCGMSLESAALGLGHAAVFATLWLVSRSWRWLEAVDAKAAATATCFLAACGAFAPWARAGMETGTQALLVTAAALLCLRAKEQRRGFVLIGLVFALLGMNRPDGLLVVAVFALDALLAGRKLGWQRIALTAGVFLVVFGGFYAWRYSYFGYPVPNTFYAKVGATWAQVWRGFGYVGISMATIGPLVGLALLCRLTRNYLVLPGVALLYTVYIIAVGGDVMPAERFFTPLVPVLALLAAMGLRARLPSVSAIGAAAVVLLGLVVQFTVTNPKIRGDVVAHNGRIVGEWLRAHAPKGSTVATNTAGTVVFYSKLRAIDMLGLNDLHIARVEMPDLGKGHAGHEKGDGAYVLAQRPEFVHLGSAIGWAPLDMVPEPPFPGDRQLWHNPEFRKRYKLYHRKGDTLWAGGNRCGVFGFWVREDIHARLPK